MRLFNDTYKRANDAIPTADAKARVMARIERPAKGAAYKKAMEITALAACLTFTVAAVNIYNRFERNIKEEISVGTDIDIKENDIPENGVPELDTPEINIRETEEPARDVPQTALKEEVCGGSKTVRKDAQQTEKGTDSYSKAAAIRIETQQSDSVIPPENDVAAAKETVIKVNEAKTDNAGVAAVHSREVWPVREVTLSEYYDYLGKNIGESVRVPENFENITQETAFFKTDDDGNFVNDEWNFIFCREEDTIEIITTGNTETVQSVIDSGDYSKSTVCGEEAVVIKDDDFYRTYMVSEKIGYTVNTSGLEEAELEGLLESLAE